MTFNKLKYIAIVIALFAGLIFFVLHPLKCIAALLFVVMLSVIVGIIES
jgi:hypothetical protein